MAIQRDPSDLNQTNDDFRSRQILDNELQADPELGEGNAGGGRMALFAIAVIAILGVVFYGLNNSSTNTASNPAPATTAQQNTPSNTMSPANPNANPGQTTGSAPAPQSGVPSSDSNNSGGAVTNSPVPAQNGSDAK